MQIVKPQDIELSAKPINDTQLLTVLGVDTAFANMGFARMKLDIDTMELTLDRLRTVSTEKQTGKKKAIRQNSDDLRRGRELFAAIHAELEGCDVVFAEIPSGAQHARSALGFGISLGVLASIEKPLVEVMPVDTKLASVGTKTAEKSEVISWAASLYPEAQWRRYAKDTPKNRAGDLHLDNEHEADAIGVVHAGIQMQTFKDLLSMWRTVRTK